MSTKFVNVGGESRPVKFGFNALIEFSESTGRTIEDLNNININSFSLRDLMLLCWCALKQGARKEGLEFDATVEDIGDWMDDTPEALVEVIKEYKKSREVDNSRQEVKKNLQRKQSR